MEKSTKEYIEHQLNVIKTTGLLNLYIFPMIFFIIDVVICVIIRSNMPLIFLLVINIPIFLVVIVTVLSRYESKKTILCGALIYTDTSMVFLVLSFLILSSLTEVSILYIVFGIAIYIFTSIFSILNMVRIIKKPNYFSSAKYKNTPSSAGIIGGMVGVIMAKWFVPRIEEQFLVLIISMLCLFISLFFSIGSQLYLCYHLMKKEKTE